ncbi:hypothetical protein RclHR1_32880001 [Rhizophagus clarus]|uniref:Reverse transcriptase domain-containing protein n=1 Tax=Rhizophagus clarus TaxID=94130 RepID=A0A2Z6S2V4_9GLOM|nr:hypothetical protein RclHR1_32880001 [Rhizophagus clarus]
MTDNNFNYDSFVRNPPNPLDIDNLSLQDSLFSSTSLTSLPRNSFNISSFNINGLKMFSHNKIELLNNFFSLKQISFGDVVDTHLHPKQMHFLSKRLSNYTVFSSVLDTFQHIRSSGGPACARQLKRQVRRIFSFDSVTPSQWDDFSVHIDTLCSISPTIFASWHINRMCEYLHANIIAGANAILPARTVGNDHIPKLPKDLETLIQHYRFLNRVVHSIKLLRKHPHTLSSSYDQKWSGYLPQLNNIFYMYKSTFPAVPTLPSSLFSCRTDNFNNLFQTLSHASKLLRGLHLLKEKEFQDSSIKAHLESRDQNFDTDISSFINSALFRSHHRIMLDRVFMDHPTTPQLLTDPKDVSDAVINHFQHAVPIKSTPPSHISALPDRWRSEYSPMATVSPDIYSSLLSPPSLEEWLSTVSSMPNGEAPGPSMITYEMLKHLGLITNSLLLILVRKCFASADIPDLWRQAMIFPIPKPHEWRCQLKNTRPITLLEVIQKSFVKLFYNRLSAILATHNVLKGGNFAGLPGGTCRDLLLLLNLLFTMPITIIPLFGFFHKTSPKHLTQLILLC